MEFSFNVVTRKIAQALAAGCPVVLKPASATPLTALALAEILTRGRVARGVLMSSLASLEPARRGVLRDPKVRKIAFTGSTEVGKELMAKASISSSTCRLSRRQCAVRGVPTPT